MYFGANDLPGIIKHLGLNYRENLVGERVLTTPPHYAYMKISEGCDRQLCFLCHSHYAGKTRFHPR